MRTTHVTACVAAILIWAASAYPAFAQTPIVDDAGSDKIPAFIGSTASARPLRIPPVPAHPFMAAPGRAAIHGDAYSSDAHPAAGPLGIDPTVVSASKGKEFAQCSTVTFAQSGNLVANCASGEHGAFTLHLMDPRTLADLATFRLPVRPSTIRAIHTKDLSHIYQDSSGGAYFYLDDQDRAVLIDSSYRLLRVAHEQGADGNWQFRVADQWDLSPHIPHDCPTWENPDPKGECDLPTSVMPDWEGRLWWVTRKGRIGTVDPKRGAIRLIALPGEEIQNSFSVAKDGVSVVSDHALYHLRADRDGTPKILWRETYDRGTGHKPGSINQGSGTTPTLLGTRYVAITDNADDRMHVLVYRREPAFKGRRLVCKLPVFGSGRSTTDNSLIGIGNSLVVENNYGYHNFTTVLGGKSVVGGLTRIDIRKDGQGCEVVWTSPERSPSTVAKLSLGSGLLYFYTKDPRDDGVDAWYLTAVEFATGRTVYKVLTGTGKSFDNNWSPITIGPDGTAYVSVLNGIVAVRDGSKQR